MCSALPADLSPVTACLWEMLSIASPTGQEQAFNTWMKERMRSSCPHWDCLEAEDSLIFGPQDVLQGAKDSRPHLALVGHSDVVPAHFSPRLEAGRLHGSGASDMKGALAAFVCVLQKAVKSLEAHYRLSLVIYAREEQTPLVDNGLYHLIQTFPDYFKSIDTAIIGEPTDNTVQLGCVGSIHATARITGKACHSARPWNGENAQYKALPFMQHVAQLQPEKHTVFGLPFFDVIQLTESQCQPGRTSLPGWWQGNINYRFAPVKDEQTAWQHLQTQLRHTDFDVSLTLLDSVPAGNVVTNPCFETLMAHFQALGVERAPKQAWTDVAQLTAHGIAAFNFGPGLTAQAHTEDEHILVQDLETYLNVLHQGLANPNTSQAHLTGETP